MVIAQLLDNIVSVFHFHREETMVTMKSCLFRALNLVIYFTTSDVVLVIMLLPIVLTHQKVTPEMVFLPLG